MNDKKQSESTTSQSVKKSSSELLQKTIESLKNKTKNNIKENPYQTQKTENTKTKSKVREVNISKKTKKYNTSVYRIKRDTVC